MVGKVTPNDQLSASEVPVLMGASKFMTVNELLKQKMDVISGIEPPFKENESMFWGNTLETTILNESCARLGLGNPKTTHLKPYFHKSIPIACSLDGTVTGDNRTIMTDIEKGVVCVNGDEIVLNGMGVVEAKLTAHEVESAHDLPLYRGPLQLQMQMDITGAKWGAVCVLYKGTTLKTFVYQRDEEVIARIHEAVIDFQRRLDKYKTNDETEWYDMESTKEAASIFDEAEKTEIELDEAVEDVNKIIELRELHADIEEQIKNHELRIMNLMRDNQYALVGQHKVSWPMINYKGTPEKVVPARPPRTVRQSKLRIRSIDNG